MQVDVEKIVREYLPDIIHMSLATSKDNKPWVCEVHYAFDDDLSLYFRSLTSRRHSQEIVDNSSVAGNIVRQHQPGEYPLGVYFEGTASLLEPGPDQDKAYDVLNNRFKSGEKVLKEAQNPDGHQFYKIEVRSWYVFGNLDGSGGKKYELSWPSNLASG
jgi:uncharacterized protein YhbP (UPF0306 family)